MSMTALERGNPPPRRRSCAACTKAKRRCDFALPACLRCSRRNIACQYPGRSNANTPASSSAPTPAHIASPQHVSFQSPDMLGMSSDAIFDCLLDDVLPEGALRTTLDIGIQEERRSDHAFRGLAGMELPGPERILDLVQVDMAMPLAATSRGGYEPIPLVIEERLGYTLDQMKKIPAMMARETRTPWAHESLYRETMPKSIRDAHACCGLYTVKNHINGPVIMRSIEIYAQELVDSPDPSTRLEVLARTQAFILYAIIRIFDGDVSARATAEHQIPCLEASALALLSHITFPEAESDTVELPLFPLAAAQEFWRNWVFLESARRTLLFSFHFMLIYSLLTRKETPSCEKSMVCRSWTLSAHLWGARDALEFAVAWRTKRHYVVTTTNALFASVVDGASADDVDEFGKMFLSTFMGVTQARGWFMTRGGTL